LASSAVQRWADFIRKQQRPFKVNIAKNLVQNFSLALTQQYQPIYLSGLGADPFELGYINGIGGVASTVLSIPTGWIADNFGIKKVLIATILATALSSVIFGLAGSWAVASIALVISSMTFTLGYNVCPMICGASLESEERVTGMQLCDTISAAPRMIAPIVAASLITAFGGMNVEGIRPLYWMQFIGLLVATLIIHAFFTDPRAKRAESASLTFLGGLERVLKEGSMPKRWIATAMLTAFPWYTFFYIPLYAAEVKGANQFIIGGMGTASMLLVTLLALPTGRLADTFGRKRLIALMTPMALASYLLLIFAPNDAVLVASGLLNGFFMLAGVTQGAIEAELVPQEILGSWYGVLGLFRGIVNIASPVICGLIWDVVGPAYVFYFLIATQIAGLAMLLSMPSDITR
jgi:MFS family permease